MSEILLTEANFSQEVLQAKEPVLVDFSATWCGPCRMLGPIVEELATQMQGVKIGKLDVDQESSIAQQYSIMSVPTLLFFKDGKVMEQMIGVQDKAVIQAKLEELK